MHHRLNLEGNVTYMGEGESFGASETLGLDSLALWQWWWRCYDTYDTNKIWRLKYNMSYMSGLNIASKRALMWFGEAQWAPTQNLGKVEG